MCEQALPRSHFGQNFCAVPYAPLSRKTVSLALAALVLPRILFLDGSVSAGYGTSKATLTSRAIRTLRTIPTLKAILSSRKVLILTTILIWRTTPITIWRVGRRSETVSAK